MSFPISKQLAQRLKDAESRAMYIARVDAGLGIGTTPHTFSTSAQGSYLNFNQEVILSGAVGFWKMDDTDATMVDSSDPLTAHDGTHFNSPVPVTGGVANQSGTALLYNGITQYSTVPTLTFTTLWSIEVVAKWMSGTQSLVRDASTGGAGWIFMYDSGGLLAFRIAGTDFVTAIPTAAIQGSFKHFVLTKSGADVEFFVNGTSVFTDTGSPSTTSVAPWYVAKDGLDANYVAATIQNLAMYDTVLSSTDITRHYNAFAGIRTAE